MEPWIEKSIWAQYGINPGFNKGSIRGLRLKNQSRTQIGNQGSIWDQSRTQIGNQGSIWDQSGTNPGPIWDQSRTQIDFNPRPRLKNQSLINQDLRVRINPEFNPGRGGPGLKLPPPINYCHNILSKQMIAPPMGHLWSIAN